MTRPVYSCQLDLESFSSAQLTPETFLFLFRFSFLIRYLGTREKRWHTLEIAIIVPSKQKDQLHPRRSH